MNLVSLCGEGRPNRAEDTEIEIKIRKGNQGLSWCVASWVSWLCQSHRAQDREMSPSSSVYEYSTLEVRSRTTSNTSSSSAIALLADPSLRSVSWSDSVLSSPFVSRRRGEGEERNVHSISRVTLRPRACSRRNENENKLQCLRHIVYCMSFSTG